MSNDTSLRILIADDHYLVRMGLAALVTTEPNMLVIGEAEDGEQAVQQYHKLKPDLALLDLRMPVKGGIEAAREIRAAHPTARLLVLTAFDGDEDIHRAIEAGALGYVLKSTTGDKLIPAIKAVAAGQRWMPSEINSRLAQRKTFEPLTPREQEVLQQLARGLANKEIADKLGISEHTTKDHLKHILGKLRVADRTEAVTVAIQRGILHL